MQYVEAFQKLGYQLANARQDWSAQNEYGVCVTIWTKELAKMAGKSPLYFDLWELHPDGGEWEKKAGHKKRTRHIAHAVEKFDGKVDVIFVSGEPGESYKDADPWLIKGQHLNGSRPGCWKIIKFCAETGYFRAEVQTLA